MKHLRNYKNGKIVTFDPSNGNHSQHKSLETDVETSGLFETVGMSDNLWKWSSVPVAVYSENGSLILQISKDRWCLKPESLKVNYIFLYLRKLIITVEPGAQKYFIGSFFSLKWDGTSYVDIDDWPTPPYSLFELIFSYCRTSRVDELIKQFAKGQYPIEWM